MLHMVYFSSDKHKQWEYFLSLIQLFQLFRLCWEKHNVLFETAKDKEAGLYLRPHKREAVLATEVHTHVKYISMITMIIHMDNFMI